MQENVIKNGNTILNLQECKTFEEQWDAILGWGLIFETENDVNYQKKLYQLIKSILDDNNIDYLTKLREISLMIIGNKSYKKEYGNLNLIDDEYNILR